MTICFFGIYDPDYSRNRILAYGLEQNECTVIHCRVDPRAHGRVGKYIELIKEYRKIRADYSIDYLLVAFPGHTVVWLAWLFHGKNIIWDAYVSLFDVNVSDRKVFRLFSWGAFKSWFSDWLSGRLSASILFDTYAHIDFFVRMYRLPRHKFIRVLIGADDRVFYPRGKTQIGNTTTIHFHGSFIPVQGLEVILEAARMMKDEPVTFQLIGDGPLMSFVKTYVEEHKLEESVSLPGKVPYEEIPDYIAGADICLGIFGDSQKTQRVIPNKVYEYAAMGKPIITARTPAIQEVFVHQVSAYFISTDTPEKLVYSIRALQNDTKKVKKIAHSAERVFDESARPRIIARELLKHI